MKYHNDCNGFGESLRLEAVTTCVGFDDMLDVSLAHNHAHVDTMIVVTAHHDHRTKSCARKHGAHVVETDLFGKNARRFNKGAAINEGFSRLQYHGWRLHLDADVILPDNFRRALFSHEHLDPECIYGADRIDVIGRDGLRRLREHHQSAPQFAHGFLVCPHGASPGISARYVDTLRGYVPIGFFQMWHASCHREYPWGIGTAAHDDVAFAAQWPRSHRRLLTSVVCYHLCGASPALGENWDGQRRQPRIDGGSHQ